MVQDPRRNVTPFRPNVRELQATIRRAAADTRKVRWGSHAMERMDQRGITTLDALRVLRTGEIDGSPEAGRGAGEWKCKVTANIRGSREIGVVTIVMSAGNLFIKTVEWEDLR